ncbi:TPA: hypothetical protein HA238_00190 [Candidatus Micrarchaeota archaeon]|nr:hypothetical protein [Candidatus Micrarchaeota archaeon]
MKQTTKNLIRGVGVAAAMAFPAGSLAVGISKAFGQPLLDEGKPKVVAQLSVPSKPENREQSKRAGSLIVHSDGQLRINPETPQEQPKGEVTDRLRFVVTIFAILAILGCTATAYIRYALFRPIHGRFAVKHKPAKPEGVQPDGEQNKGDSQ